MLRVPRDSTPAVLVVEPVVRVVVASSRMAAVSPLLELRCREAVSPRAVAAWKIWIRSSTVEVVEPNREPLERRY